jgi:hypothetical protein
MKTLIPNEKAMIDEGWNVLIVGLHGVGKSAIVRGIADRHNLKWTMFNGATMDPHTELVGIPVPRSVTSADGRTTREVLRMIRPEGIDEAELVFVDELNRAPLEVQNAILEMANERSINGEPLPNLKCVIACINPPDGDYHVHSLDLALQDRFDLFIEAPCDPQAGVMEKFDGLPKKVAEALVKWHSEADHTKRGTYISPRRLAKMGKVFMASRSKDMLNMSLTPGTVADMGKLYLMLMEAVGTPVKTRSGDSRLAGTVGETVTASSVSPTSGPSPSKRGAYALESFKPRQAGNAAIISKVGQFEVHDIRYHLNQAMSQPSRTRVRDAVQDLVNLRPDLAKTDWSNVVQAINDCFSHSGSKIVVPAS